MSAFGKAKDVAGRVKDVTEEKVDELGDLIDKGAEKLDDKTDGKYSDKIDKGVEAAKGFVDGDGEHVAVGDDEGEQQPPSRLAP